MPAIDIFGLIDETDQCFAENVRKRQRIMMEYVTPWFRFERKGPRTKQVYMQRLADEGLGISSSSVSGYIRQYYVASMFLHGEEHEKISRLLEKKDDTVVPLNILIQHGITTWEQILALEEERRAHVAETAPTGPVVQLPAAAARELSGTELAECGPIAEAIQVIIDETGRLTDHVTVLEEENHDLLLRLDEREQHIKELTASAAARDRRIQELEAAETYRIAKAIDQAAYRYPDLFQSMTKLAAQIREFEDQRNAIPEELPRTALWHGNPQERRDPVEIAIEYRSPYMDFYRRTPEARDQMVKQVVLLCEHGSRYGSLGTEVMREALFNTPSGSRWSRINDRGLRFTWQFMEETNALILYDAGREEQLKRVKRTHRSHR